MYLYSYWFIWEEMIFDEYVLETLEKNIDEIDWVNPKYNYN
jgi:hypothetical protein